MSKKIPSRPRLSRVERATLLGDLNAHEVWNTYLRRREALEGYLEACAKIAPRGAPLSGVKQFEKIWPPSILD